MGKKRWPCTATFVQSWAERFVASNAVIGVSGLCRVILVGRLPDLDTCVVWGDSKSSDLIESALSCS